MSEEKKYKAYTAADIEKYHSGMLSPKEMNEMERAALDDPFLADAIEGFGNVKVNLAADMNELQQKLEARIEKDKVIAIRPAFGFSKLLRIAAIVILVAGAGLFVFRFGINTRRNSLAVENIKPVQQQQSPSQPQQDRANATAPIKNDSVTLNATGNQGTVAYTRKATDTMHIGASNLTSGSFSTNDYSQTPTRRDTNVYYNFATTAPVAGIAIDKKVSEKEDANVTASKNFKVETKKDDAQVKDQFGAIRGDSIRVSHRQDVAMAMAQPNANRSYDNERAKNVNFTNNYFNGRVMDNNNNAIPFANVTNTRDNVGTYADANGNFILISPDSVLNLRIKSVGFISDTVRLQKNIAMNQVKLKEDKMNAVVIGKKRTGKNPNPSDNIKIEEPEPADGWSNYGLYIANNLKVPDIIKKKEISGEVQLSFEINKQGEPVNITVEKSLCKECDEEAKRLIQQGPKWKVKKKKNNRITVTVPFETNE